MKRKVQPLPTNLNLAATRNQTVMKSKYVIQLGVLKSSK